MKVRKRARWEGGRGREEREVGCCANGRRHGVLEAFHTVAHRIRLGTRKWVEECSYVGFLIAIIVIVNVVNVV